MVDAVRQIHDARYSENQEAISTMDSKSKKLQEHTGLEPVTFNQDMLVLSSKFILLPILNSINMLSFKIKW